MLNEIRDLYNEESKLYIKIIDILKSIDIEEIDQEKYQIELENVDYLVSKVGNLNSKIEQLKTLYIARNNIKDFIGEEIRRVEKEATYNDFKSVVNSTSKLIMEAKKLNDGINSSLIKNVNKLNILRKGSAKNTISKDFLFPEKVNNGSKFDKLK